MCGDRGLRSDPNHMNRVMEILNMVGVKLSYPNSDINIKYEFDRVNSGSEKYVIYVDISHGASTKIEVEWTGKLVDIQITNYDPEIDVTNEFDCLVDEGWKLIEEKDL